MVHQQRNFPSGTEKKLAKGIFLKIIYVRKDVLVFDVVDNGDRLGGTFGKSPGFVQRYLEWRTKYYEFKWAQN